MNLKKVEKEHIEENIEKILMKNKITQRKNFKNLEQENIKR